MPATLLAFPASSASAIKTIAELRDTFLDDASAQRGVSAKTMRSYRSDLIMLARELPQPLDTITRQDLEHVLMECEE